MARPRQPPERAKLLRTMTKAFDAANDLALMLDGVDEFQLAIKAIQLKQDIAERSVFLRSQPRR